MDPVEVVAVVFIALAGLAIGSFLNVVIWRVPRGESIVSPPSHCPRCDAEIRGRDNIPVLSWLILRGRCRDCGAHISARYPGVELLTGVLFRSSTLTLRPHLGAARVPVPDGRGRRPGVHRPRHQAAAECPDAAVLPDRGRSAAHPGRRVRTSGGTSAGPCWAGSALFAFYLILALMYPAGMGMGDVKLRAPGHGAGLARVGGVARRQLPGFLFGAFVGLGMMLFRGAGRKSAIPFGPFMLAGALLGILRGARDRRLVRRPAGRLTLLPPTAATRLRRFRRICGCHPFK